MLASLDPLTGLAHMWSQPYIQHGVAAGGAIAVASGLVGYFLVLRSQVFTGDALSHVALTGSYAALAVGIDLRVGLFGACVAFALLLGTLGRRGRADDVSIGSAFAWVLGLGALFLTLYTTNRSGGDSTAGVSVLFGSLFEISAGEAVLAVALAAGVVIVLVAIARPLLFSSVDDSVATARGLPVRLLGYGFLVLVAVTVGESTQAVGALLALGLLAAPAGAAMRLTCRPYRALWLSGVISLGSVLAGLCIAYAAPALPPSFAIMLVATAAVGAAYASAAIKARWPGRQPVAT